MKIEKKSRIFSSIALFLLLMAQLMFSLLIFNDDQSDPMLYAGLVYPFVFYLLCLFGAPLIFPLLWSIFGCAALCVGYYIMELDNVSFHLVSLYALAPCIFLITQLSVVSQKENRTFFSVCALLSRLLPLAQLGLILYLVLPMNSFDEDILKDDALYHTVVFLFLVVLYVWISFSVRNLKGVEKRRVTRFRLSFILAAVSILETLVISRLSMSFALLRSIPLLWVLNLIFLHAAGNPFVCAFAAKCKKAQARLLQDGTRKGE